MYGLETLKNGLSVDEQTKLKSILLEIKTKPHLLAELYNVKGLSERKIVAFDDALESFDNALTYGEAALDMPRIPNTDPEFEISLSYLIKGKIYTRMLDFSTANKNYKKALRTLALFQPMPSEYENAPAYNYVITNNLITHIDDLNEYDLYGLFNKVREKYNNTLIENTNHWLNVRPYPLAVYLISEWFEEMPTHLLESLMDDLQLQPDNIKNIPITSAW